MSLAAGEQRRWFIYALGGGAGHLVRSTSLARAAIRNARLHDAQLQVTILTNSPFADQIPVQEELGKEHSIIKLNSSWNRERTVQAVRRHILNSEFDTLIVDTFPRGLGGEIPDILSQLPSKKVLVHRNVAAEYCEKPSVAESMHSFDRIILPGESAPFETLSHAKKTRPWLIRDADELLTPQAARKRLGVETETVPVVAVVGCGNGAEVNEMRRLAEQLRQRFHESAVVRFIAPDSTISGSQDLNAYQRQTKQNPVKCIWPLLEVIRGINVLVGSGGYNTANEARATQTPFIGIPRKRLYDCQEKRLASFTDPVELVDVANRLAKVLSHPLDPSCPAPGYVNGVHEAAKIVFTI